MWVTRALPNVGPLLGDEVGVEDEALPALRALSGPPLPVPPLVLGQVRAPGKALPTLRTLVGPLPVVDPLVET